MIDPHLRPGHAQIEAASKFAADSDEWKIFMKDVMELPMSMLPAVQRVIRSGTWKLARDPIQTVRVNAERDNTRRLLRNARSSEGKAE